MQERAAERLAYLTFRRLARRGGSFGEWWGDSLNWLITNELRYMGAFDDLN